MKTLKKQIIKLGSAIAAMFLSAVQVDNPAKNFFIDLTGKVKDVKDPNSFEGLGVFIIQGILAIVGVLALVFLVIGGVRYITAGDDSEAAEGGKKTVTNAIIGLVIVILSYVVIAVVVNALYGRTGNNTTPEVDDERRNIHIELPDERTPINGPNDQRLPAP